MILSETTPPVKPFLIPPLLDGLFCGADALDDAVADAPADGGAVTGAEAAAEADSILVRNLQIRSRSPKTLKAAKCACRRSWCPSCGKKTLRRLLARIASWDPRRVRMITLTLNHDLFESAQQAFEHITKTKAISALFRNLERVVGVPVDDWCWCLEWHKGGWAHWHVLVQVKTPGKAGMIGGDNLRRYWPYGAVRESYIQNERHWKHMIGYWGAHGYFEDKKGKAHQVVLPEWALDSPRKIRRFGAKRLHKPQEPEFVPTRDERPGWDDLSSEQKVDELGAWFDRAARRDLEPNRVALERCGQAVEVYSDGPGWAFVGLARIPYKEFLRRFPGVFEPGRGWVFEVPDFMTFAEEVNLS